MSISLANITFPNYVTGMSNGSGYLKGGYDYQTQMPSWIRLSIINDLISFNLSTLSWTVAADTTATSEWYPVFTFPNGYSIRVQFIQAPQTGQGNTPCVIKSALFDESGVQVVEPDVSMARFTKSLSTDYSTSYGNMDGGDCVAYIYLITNYYPTANPAEGTACNGLSLEIALGFESYGFVLTRGQIASNAIQAAIDANYAITEIFDIEKLETYLHGHGNSFSGDVFTDDDLPEDPAGSDDTSGTGGGGGNYDPSSDPVDFPDLPIGGPLTSGMIKGFVMNQGNLQGLQAKLWDMSLFDVATQFQKLVNQPLDCVISLHCLPFTPTEGSAEEIKLGSFATGILANRITAQYMTIDAGTINIREYWGSALDYAPFTQCDIFVPFVGFRNIKVEDIQNSTLHLKYHVDVLTGDCVAYLKCGTAVMYTWTGNCLVHIPVTANSSDLLAKNIAAVGSVGLGLVTGNPAAAAAGAIAGAVNTATAKNHVQRSGEVAGSPGVMSEFTPYLIFHRPKQSLAKNYNIFKGYTSNITYTLNNLSGYTEVEHIHLTGISGATGAELNEIEQLLKQGVII